MIKSKHHGVINNNEKINNAFKVNGFKVINYIYANDCTIYYVSKDYAKYVEIIKGLYPLIQGATNTFDPVPEIYSRLAKIYVEEGNEDQAIQLLLIAKEFQSQRLIYSQFFGDLTIMKYIILDLYSLIQFDPNYMDLFDLYYALQKPCSMMTVRPD